MAKDRKDHMAKSPRIVTIGGGTGAPIVIQSLLLAGFENITAVTASMDSGGKTGTIRSDERDRVIAVSDLLRTLISLIPPESNHIPQIEAFTSLAEFTDGRNRNLGYTLYYALLEKYQDDFPTVQKHLEQLLGLHFCRHCHSDNFTTHPHPFFHPFRPAVYR